MLIYFLVVYALKAICEWRGVPRPDRIQEAGVSGFGFALAFGFAGSIGLAILTAVFPTVPTSSYELLPLFAAAGWGWGAGSSWNGF